MYIGFVYWGIIVIRLILTKMNKKQMKFSVFIATSLDGYIAKEDGSLDWLTSIPTPANNDLGYGEFISGIDAILMGRNTFNVVKSFGQWPYEVPVFVWSKTLSFLPDDYSGRASVITGDVNEVVRKLKECGKNSIYVDGGKTIQTFLNMDMIDQMIITIIPVLLGKGIPLFGTVDKEKSFIPVKSEVLNNTFIQLTLKRYSQDLTT